MLVHTPARIMARSFTAALTVNANIEVVPPLRHENVLKWEQNLDVQLFRMECFSLYVVFDIFYVKSYSYSLIHNILYSAMCQQKQPHPSGWWTSVDRFLLCWPIHSRSKTFWSLPWECPLTSDTAVCVARVIIDGRYSTALSSVMKKGFPLFCSASSRNNRQWQKEKVRRRRMWLIVSLSAAMSVRELN